MAIKEKQKLMACLFILIGGNTLVLSGCATTKAELLSQEDKQQTWRVNQPIGSVFKTYRDYA